MSKLLSTSLFCAICLVLSACQEIPGNAGQSPMVDARGMRTCLNAVDDNIGLDGAVPNNSPVVLEVGHHMIDAADGSTWSCYTDASGQAQTLIKRSG